MNSWNLSWRLDSVFVKRLLCSRLWLCDSPDALMSTDENTGRRPTSHQNMATFQQNHFLTNFFETSSKFFMIFVSNFVYIFIRWVKTEIVCFEFWMECAHFELGVRVNISMFFWFVCWFWSIWFCILTFLHQWITA